MLKKTLIAFAALSSLVAVLPAQAQDWEQRHQEVRHHQSPSIRFVVYQHAERGHFRHHGHHHYRHHGDRHDHRQDRGRDYRQDQRQDHRGDHH